MGLKLISKDEAIRLAKSFGCKSPEEFKKDFTGERYVSEYNMMRDTETKEIVLEPISGKGEPIRTEYFIT
jgi:hypothetical protein